MDYQALYQQKLTTPEEAVKVVKSGDWVDYTWCTNHPVALDRALAARKDELTDVKIRGGVTMWMPEIAKAEDAGDHFTWHSWHCSGIDRKIIGNNKARYRYGFNITADWKGFDLGIFFQGVGKRDMYLPNNYRYQYGSEWQVPQGYANDYWREDNTGAYFPVARFNGSGPLGVTQTRYLLDASYLRLKSLTFGYTLPETLTQKAYIQKARIYFSAENLFTIKHTPEGFDPELDDPYKYPMQRALSLGVSLTF